jgi:hypothetical protein
MKEEFQTQKVIIIIIFFRIDSGRNLCVFDDCSRLTLDDCLQHDMEGMDNN